MSTPPTVPPLRRASAGRLVGGVARGVAEHLGVDVWWVRLGFVVLTLVSGAGLLAYAALWALVPLDTSSEEAAQSGQGGQDRHRPGDRRSTEGSLLLVLGACGVVLGGLLLASLLGVNLRGFIPLAVAGLGAALIWLRADQEQRERLRTGVERVTPQRAGVVQVALGALLVLVGLVAFGVGGVGVGQAGALLVAVVVVVLGLLLVLSPFVLRVWRERDSERRARIRSEERAEIAAHVHDSVLQSLALIQRNAGDPGAVARIARAQERDLRRWLYPTPATFHSSLRSALEEMAGEIEDAHGTRVDLVCVGDLPMDELWSPLVQATREAVANAARHSGADVVSVYAEMADGAATVHVRDRGVGFDVDAVPDDRMGLRESIVGRLQRHGGRATIESEPGTGTRVELVMEAR